MSNIPKKYNNSNQHDYAIIYLFKNDFCIDQTNYLFLYFHNELSSFNLAYVCFINTSPMRVDKFENQCKIMCSCFYARCKSHFLILFRCIVKICISNYEQRYAVSMIHFVF